MDKLAELLGVNRYHINFASEKEILTIGFPLGGIAPFGFESNDNILKFVDTGIITHRCKWLYTGTGDNRKTLKIKRQDFLKIIADYRQEEL
jgi:prolyl-tRNA editing enzyme YbaK/EbsC (Cys-tRNA(Pro) deacylase)